MPIDNSLYLNQNSPDMLGGLIKGMTLKSLAKGGVGQEKDLPTSNLSSLTFSDGDFGTFHKLLQADRKFNQPNGYNLGVLPAGPNVFSNNWGK